MKTLCGILIFFFATSVGAAGFCERPKATDPDVPSGLAGKYEIIGRLPGSQSGYTGFVTVKETKTAYALTRTVAGHTETGEGWIELCSPDKFMVFNFKYTNPKQPLFGTCFFRADGDNYFLMSCRTRFSDTDDKHHGLEALFQLHEP